MKTIAIAAKTHASGILLPEQLSIMSVVRNANQLTTPIVARADCITDFITGIWLRQRQIGFAPRATQKLTAKCKMIIKTCPACAAPLAHDAPRCVRCRTRYCNATCQHDHWRRGHKQMCKKIHRGGNAEQYHAEKKYKEAVAVAVEACADNTKGQTCYICTEAVVRRTGEGLVNAFCACRGGSSFAHVSCLAEQAKTLVAEAEENNLDERVKQERWQVWGICRLCGQDYHGVVLCALGWACWKTYSNLPEESGTGAAALQRNNSNKQLNISAMGVLANGLNEVGRHEEALMVNDSILLGNQALASLATLSGYRMDHRSDLAIQSSRADCLSKLGRHEESLAIHREVYG